MLSSWRSLFGRVTLELKAVAVGGGRVLLVVEVVIVLRVGV